jgi:hypothetical protein
MSISKFLIMCDVNCRIGKNEVEKLHKINAQKFCNSGKCNSVENRSSKGKSCKAERVNKWIFMKPRIESLNGKFETDTTRKFFSLII